MPSCDVYSWLSPAAYRVSYTLSICIILLMICQTQEVDWRIVCGP